MLFYRGAKRTMLRSQPIVLSVTAIFPAPALLVETMLARIAKAHSATRRQIALAFLTRRASIFAIPKAASSDHAKENAKAGDIHLTDTEIARLDAAFPRGTRRATLPML